jgi:hypothetical protein
MIAVSDAPGRGYEIKSGLIEKLTARKEVIHTPA